MNSGISTADPTAHEFWQTIDPPRGTWKMWTPGSQMERLDERPGFRGLGPELSSRLPLSQAATGPGAALFLLSSEGLIVFFGGNVPLGMGELTNSSFLPCRIILGVGWVGKKDPNVFGVERRERAVP